VQQIIQKRKNADKDEGGEKVNPKRQSRFPGLFPVSVCFESFTRLLGNDRITAGRASPDKIFVPAGETAFWAVYGGKESSAGGAVFCRHVHFGAAVVAKKPGLFCAHYRSAYAIFDTLWRGIPKCFPGANPRPKCYITAI
jgi:hypothetical protein